MMETSTEPRRLSLWLILGVYSAPLVFCWFLLRSGYSSHVRRGGFLLAAFSVMTAIAAAQESPFR